MRKPRLIDFPFAESFSASSSLIAKGEDVVGDDLDILVAAVGSTKSSRGAVDMDRSGVNGLVETVSEDTACII